MSNEDDETTGQNDQEAAAELFQEPKSQCPTETGDADGPPPAPPIKVTPVGEGENKPQTPLADAKRASSDFVVTVDGVDLPPAQLVQDSEDGSFNYESPEDILVRVLDTPELKRKFPMNEGMEDSVWEFLSSERTRQEQLIREGIENDELAEELQGFPLDPEEQTERVVEFSARGFEDWRHAQSCWGCGNLDRPDMLKAARALLSKFDKPKQKITVNNFIARGLLAPGFCLPGLLECRNDDENTWFHRGYEWFSAWTDVFDAEDPALGLDNIPVEETRGPDAHLWLYTHKLGMLFLTSVKNPQDLTDAQAGALVRKLRKSTVVPQDLHRLWMLTNFGNQRLNVDEALQLLASKNGLALHSNEAVAGYREAMRRVRDANFDICPKHDGEAFDFETECQFSDDDRAAIEEAGATKLAVFDKILRERFEVREALHAIGVGAWDTAALTSTEGYNLACLWFAAHRAKNEEAITHMTAWGAVDQLRRWVTKFSVGRNWIVNVQELAAPGEADIPQTLGWGSYSEWLLLMELFRYGMQKGWEAFIDLNGCSHTVWNNSLFDKDINPRR